MMKAQCGDVQQQFSKEKFKESNFLYLCHAIKL